MNRRLPIDPPAIVRPADEMAELAKQINAAHQAGQASMSKGMEAFRSAHPGRVRDDVLGTPRHQHPTCDHGQVVDDAHHALEHDMAPGRPTPAGGNRGPG